MSHTKLSRTASVSKGGSLPSKNACNTMFRRGFLSSDKRFAMPEMEESQFLIRLKQDTRQRLQVSEEEEEEGNLVTLLVQADLLVLRRKGRSWDWKLGCIRRYGYSSSEFYFESGRRSKTGEGLFTFITDIGERIHSRFTMVKEFCQFDLYCQRGVIPEFILASDPPNRARSLKDKSERQSGQHGDKETSGRRTSTGSLPF